MFRAKWAETSGNETERSQRKAGPVHHAGLQGLVQRRRISPDVESKSIKG